MLLEHDPRLEVIGLDLDVGNIEVAGRRLSGHGERFRLIPGDCGDLRAVLAAARVERVGGILAD